MKIGQKAHKLILALYILAPDQSPLDNVEGIWASNKPFEENLAFVGRVCAIE